MVRHRVVDRCPARIGRLRSRIGIGEEVVVKKTGIIQHRPTVQGNAGGGDGESGPSPVIIRYTVTDLAGTWYLNTVNTNNLGNPGNSYFGQMAITAGGNISSGEYINLRVKIKPPPHEQRQFHYSYAAFGSGVSLWLREDRNFARASGL